LLLPVTVHAWFDPDGDVGTTIVVISAPSLTNRSSTCTSIETADNTAAPFPTSTSDTAGTHALVRQRESADTPSLHGVPSASAAFAGMPAEHAPVVHGVFAGVFVSSSTDIVPPAPSHSIFWHVPGVCELVGVPADVNVWLHVWAVQKNVTQSVVVPQSAAMSHATQLPAPSHTPPVHDVSGGCGVEPGEPAVQVPVAHCVDAGVSASFSTWITLPLPSHSAVLQSPAVCCPAGSAVPFPVNENPHVLVVHVRVWQNVSVPGQSVANTQPTQLPLPSQISFVPHVVPSETGGFDGTPFVHTAPTHGLLVVGTSLLSAIDVM
jgi:hypothetical protein